MFFLSLSYVFFEVFECLDIKVWINPNLFVNANANVTPSSLRMAVDVSVSEFISTYSSFCRMKPPSNADTIRCFERFKRFRA